MRRRRSASDRTMSSMTDTLILLPGLVCDAAVWAPVQARLGGLRCIVPTYGTLDSVDAMARSVLETAPEGPLAVAGHSMGGRVALEMARRAPHRISRIALLDTGYQALPPGPAGAAEQEGRLALLGLARAQGMAAMGRQWARGMVHPARLDGTLFNEVVAMVARHTPEVFEAQIRALLARPDATAVLRGLRCPTLLLCGREDAWSPLARHQDMQALAPGSSLVVVDDCGHMSPMEQPAAVGEALRRWLDAAPGTD